MSKDVKLDEFIEKLKELQKQGLGNKKLNFDYSSITNVEYDEDRDIISLS